MERSTHQVLTRDGVNIACDLYHAANADAVLVICPGFFQSKGTPTFQRLACTLAKDCDIICMDFRGHGRSDGLFTFSACEQADLDAVVRWAKERYQRLGILGFSLGAATAINLASHRDDINTLIAISAPTAFEEIEFRFWTPEAIQTGLAGLEPGAGCRPGNPWFKKERPIETIRRLARTPALLMHGTKDATILPRHSQRLYEAAKEPKRLILIEGGGHAEELFREQPEQFLSPVQDWLRTTLLAAETSGAGAEQDDAGWFEICPGRSLFSREWTKPDAQRPLIILHGAGEHSGRYANTAARMLQEGYAVYSFDLPGHGHSPGTRGHIRHFEDYVMSVRQFIGTVAARHPGQAPILLGHSLGGLIGTVYAIRHPETIRCLVLSSPLWGLGVHVPWWECLLARGLSPLWPSVTFQRPRLDEALSHDPAIAARYRSDPLVHDRASVRFYTELQQQLRHLRAILPHLTVPVLVVQAGEDRIASRQAVERLFPSVGSAQKRLLVYAGYYHEVFNEVGRERVLQDVCAWLRDVCR